ncbi:aminopeptidase, partial [Bacillus altitudinis]|uniref:aminopeptidase n=1 Tax=Bacillus altitudinis TaxID=293387 RepID=UPI0011A49EFF
PHHPDQEPLPLLSHQIFKLPRPHHPHPLQPSKNHHQSLNQKLKLLNQPHYHNLHYQAPPTHLTIQLPQHHISVHAPNLTEHGLSFIANIPTQH